MEKPAIGILGYGYLGNELSSLEKWSEKSWCTLKEAPEGHETIQGFTSVGFDWSKSDTWSNLPSGGATLVLTIPPVFRDEQQEQERLKEWCDWMKEHRSEQKRLVYISSTGVYPNLPGMWSEEDSFFPDTDKGGLRLSTEKQLSKSFEIRIIRAGAIYGRGRNIGTRILGNKPIPGGAQRIHRIHVRDLARIVYLAATATNFPRIVNAIDLESETTSNVADWLCQQYFFPRRKKQRVQYSSEFETRKFDLSEPKRSISNEVLKSFFKYQYPTYREGLKDAFD